LSTNIFSTPRPIQLSRRAFGAALAAPLLFAFAPPAYAQSRFSAGLVAARAKLTAYNELYRATQTMEAGWLRYFRSVDPDIGPKGTESRLLGFPKPNSAAAQADAAEKAANSPPKEEEADRAAKALVHFYRLAFPDMVEAADFYPTYVPKDDLGKAGQIWHRRLKQNTGFLPGARADLYKAADAMRGRVEAAELVELEKRGRNEHWHVRRLTLQARAARDAFPLGPGPFDPDAVAKQMAAFEAVAAETEAYNKANPGKLLMFDSSPRSFITTMNRLRDQISKRPEARTVTEADLRTALTAYAQMVEMGDLFFMNSP
jgi:hypothetical protein